MDPVVRRVLLIAGGSVVLALVSFAVAVAVSGDPLGSAVAGGGVDGGHGGSDHAGADDDGTAHHREPDQPGRRWCRPAGLVHTDPATGYQVAVPPGWEVASDGGPAPSCATRAPRRSCGSTGSRTPRPTR